MKKSKSKTRSLKDFDIVAHVIPIASNAKFCHFGDNYNFLALYINRYGLEVGALVKDTKSGKIYSWDHYIWEEYLWEQDEKCKPGKTLVT